MEINKTYNEDCLQTMARMPDNFIDLTVTSPPYDSLRNYHGYSFDFEPIAKSLYRVTKQGGIVVWIVGDATIKGNEAGTSFKQALYFKEIGFNLYDTMIYHKVNPLPNESRRYQPSFEYMFILSKGRPNTFNPLTIPAKCYIPGGQDHGLTSRKADGSLKTMTGKLRNHKPQKLKHNVWDYNTGYMHSSTDKIAFKHPAIFPEQLAKDHILSWSNENDLIYDPFMGSGTIAKIALSLNRNYIGSELSSAYCEIITERTSIQKNPI